LYRPQTAKDADRFGIDAFDNKDLEQEAGFVDAADSRFPNFKVPEKMKEMLARTHTEQTRLQTMVEMQQINEKLSRDGFPISMTTLNRAMMVPEEIEWKPAERVYPDPGYGLMINPFPKPKKKKKGKKKK